MLTSSPSLNQIREVDLNDLLGRDEIRINTGQVRDFLRAKTVPVTGVGGSIGSELCREILKRNPKTLLLVERHENSLFEIHRELSAAANADILNPILCDVTNENRIMKVFQQWSPDLVFHAAAHKHVPIQEIDAAECFVNNVG